MVTNFESITHELTDEELRMVGIIMQGFAKRTKDNPIKEPALCESFNVNRHKFHIKGKLTGARLRKIVNHIRTNGLQPLIATSKGYYVSSNPDEIKRQIQSLNERAASIRNCAIGLQKFVG